MKTIVSIRRNKLLSHTSQLVVSDKLLECVFSISKLALHLDTTSSFLRKYTFATVMESHSSASTDCRWLAFSDLVQPTTSLPTGDCTPLVLVIIHGGALLFFDYRQSSERLCGGKLANPGLIFSPCLNNQHHITDGFSKEAFCTVVKDIRGNIHTK